MSPYLSWGLPSGKPVWSSRERLSASFRWCFCAKARATATGTPGRDVGLRRPGRGSFGVVVVERIFQFRAVPRWSRIVAVVKRDDIRGRPVRRPLRCGEGRVDPCRLDAPRPLFFIDDIEIVALDAADRSDVLGAFRHLLPGVEVHAVNLRGSLSLHFARQKDIGTDRQDRDDGASGDKIRRPVRRVGLAWRRSELPTIAAPSKNGIRPTSIVPQIVSLSSSEPNNSNGSAAR